MRISVGIACLALLVLTVSGCVTMDSEMAMPPAQGRTGVYHKVLKGETLWRIAKTYDVDIEELIRVNRIPNVAHLEENQLLFIPRAQSVKSVIPVVTTTQPTQAALEAVKDDFGWPVIGRISKYFGEQRGSYLHHGISIETMEGQPVAAARQGKVVFADYLPGYAYTVILDHLDGYFTVYGFNSRLSVKVGDPVRKGDPIALTGRRGTSPLLYFEIRRHVKAENPLYFLPKI